MTMFDHKEVIMETMQFLVQVVSTVGFPIFMCVLLWKQNEDQDTRHQKEIKELTQAVDNNTKVLELLSERIGDR